ncbi:MAG: hypothetical protein NTV66_07575 [Methylococcales bacterium]|nr:hypothetical protein [Methylococcales bacterium]
MTEKTLFVHAGGSKTGSSALQNFCENNASRLEAVGLAYEHRINIKSDYEINSGNGKILYKALSLATTTDNEIDSLVLSYFGSCNRAICSCEFFQYTDSMGWRKLLESSVRLGFKLKIIFYVRNVIPFLLSAYDQVIKRHGEWRLFDEWVLEAAWDHVNSLQVMSEELPKESLHVLNYDQEKKRLISSFLNFIGVNALFITDQVDHERQVNRSLTNQERNVLIGFNKVLGDTFSQQLSDFFVSKSPDLRAETVSYSKMTNQLLLDRYNNQVDWINNTFFENKPVVSILPLETISHNSHQERIINPLQNCIINEQVSDWTLEIMKKFRDGAEQRIQRKINTLYDAARNHSGNLYPGVPDDFDAVAYLLINKDVFYAEMDPVQHFINHGKAEGRAYKIVNNKRLCQHHLKCWIIRLNNFFIKYLANPFFLFSEQFKELIVNTIMINSTCLIDEKMKEFELPLKRLKILKNSSDLRCNKLLNILNNTAQNKAIDCYPGLPSDFDLLSYLIFNLDVLYSGADPIKHFINFGKAEGRIYKI